MYNLSKKYIYLSEYFNPTPIELIYRGFKGKLFKRDFAKELWKLFPKMKLIDYGFHWTEDPKRKVIVIIQTGFYLKSKIKLNEL